MTAQSIFDRRKAFGAVICGVLCLLMLVGLAFLTETDAHAATVAASGTCGDNLTWELDGEGTLTISGSGDMTSSPWRSYNSSIKTVVIGDDVTSIGSWAFQGCNLTSVTIPNSVTSIGNYAFCGCSNLTSITIPDSVTSIGEDAFFDCSVNLESITVAEGNSKYHSSGNCLIETKSNTLILGCKNSIIPSDGSVTSIGSSAFSYCSSLTSVTIPDSVTSIGNNAFFVCSSLKSVTIPNSVTSIGECAFTDCSSLTSVIIGDSVTSIGDFAFVECNELVSIVIGSGISEMDDFDQIFDQIFGTPGGNNKLKLIVIKGDGSIDLWGIFDRFSDLNTIVLCSDNACVNEYKDLLNNGEEVTIWRDNGEYVIRFDDIEMGDVKYTAFSTHSHAEDSTNWTVAENGDQVCSECGLTVAAPAPAKTEGYCGNNIKWAFDNETSTLTITGKGAMKGYSSETMPWYAYASQIKKVVIGEGVTTIGKNAFNNEKAGFVFPEISLPSTLTSIGRYAFYNCASLTEIALPASVDTIGRFAFRGTGIANVTVGRCGKTADWMLDDAGTLTIFGDGAMFDYGSKNAPWASYKDQIKKVVVCEGVTSIGNCAFYECANITSVSLPSTLTGIGNYAFYGCKALTEITVPASVNTIGAYAFRKCNSLATATFENADGWSYGDASAAISAEALKANYKNAWTRA